MSPRDASRPSVAPSEPGRRVADRYRLQASLGRGGMGTVWAAHDELLRRDVAVKEVLLSNQLDEEQAAVVRERTLREARAAARVSSPHVVTVYDVVEEDAHPWIVMERLPGPSLEEVLHDRGRLGPPEAARLGLALVDGLAAAHDAGVLHRDVKPANVMFRRPTDVTRVVLTDFGIAHLDGDATLTATGALTGSPAYVAPERARGDAATRAADLWSLGATLWATVEGQAPFLRDGAMPTLTAIVTEDLPQPVHAGPLERVLRRLLAKDPADRLDLATARQELSDVAEAAGAGAEDGQGTPPGPPATVTRLDLPIWQWPQEAEPDDEPDAGRAATEGAGGRTGSRQPDRQVLIVAGAVLVLLLVAAVGLVGVLGGDGQDEGAVAESQPSAPGDALSDASGNDLTTDQPEPTSASPSTDDGDAEAAEAAGGVPQGFERYDDETGFSLAVPAGWEVSEERPRVRFDDPGSPRYLLVDQTDTPADPVTAWEQQEEAVSQRLSDYELIGIDGFQFRGWDAADWEFTFGEDTHVLNRTFVTGPDQAYALYWSASDGDFEENLDTYRTIAQSFTPAG